MRNRKAGIVVLGGILPGALDWYMKLGDEVLLLSGYTTSLWGAVSCGRERGPGPCIRRAGV